jgi:hypothetical protein
LVLAAAQARRAFRIQGKAVISLDQSSIDAQYTALPLMRPSQLPQASLIGREDDLDERQRIEALKR